MNYPTRILLIDNDQRFGRTIKNALSSHGYDVCYASNGILGIQKAFEFVPDLVLCGIKLNPIDGYHVFNVLKECSLIDHAPFIFLTVCSELNDIRSGMDIGADDYFIKPFKNEDLIRSIEIRLAKFKRLREEGKSEFKALFKFSPDGIFLFNGSFITNLNPTLLKVLELNEDEINTLKIEDIFDMNSIQRINDQLQRCFNGVSESFKEDVTMISKSGIRTDVTIFISVYEKYKGVSSMIGLIPFHSHHSKNVDNDQIESEILQMLKKEKITVSHSFGEKLTEIFKYSGLSINNSDGNFFSTRENQVLHLSMEGLPIKLIADKLAISDRTVEKHRAKLMEKTGSNNIIEVIVYALRNKLVRWEIN